MKQVSRILLLFRLILIIGSGTLLCIAGSEQPIQPDCGYDAPARGPAAAGTVRFIALGDTGTGGIEQRRLAQRMAIYHDERPYDTVLLLGDNIYPNGNPAGLVKKFERPYAELLQRGVLFYAVLGNHDVRQGRLAQISYQLFHMGGRAYYSFTRGDTLVEFFALDSTQMDTTQLGWLEGALAASKASWKIAYLHHPIYSSRKRVPERKLGPQLEPLFVRHGVAVVFAGHRHVYERFKPQQGVQYFIAGAGGTLWRGYINRKSPFLAAGNDEFNSFLYVEVSREQLAFWAVGAAGIILDSGTVTRSPVNLRSGDGA